MWSIVGSIIVILISVAYFIMSIPLSPMAKLFPMIITTATAAFAIIWLISSIKDYIKKPTGFEINMSPEMIKLTAILFVQLFIYVFVIQIIGFYVSTLLFLIIVMWTLKLKRYIQMVSVSIVTLLIVMIVFDRYLHVDLPSGLLM